MNEVVEDVAVSAKKGSKETRLPPWDQLRKAREEHNMNPSDVAKELKLDLRLVKALEGGNVDELPEQVYTAGYIRAYAKLVGLSPEKVVADYTSQDSMRSPEPFHHKEKIPARYRAVQQELPKNFIVSKDHAEHKRKVRILLSILAVVFAIAVAWKIAINSPESGVLPAEGAAVTSKGPEANSSSEANQLSDGDQDAIASQSNVAPQDENQQQITETLQGNAKKISSISLSYSENSWVDIRDANGKPLIRRLGAAGETNLVKGQAPFEVLLGYSPGVSLEYNGEPYDLSRFHKRAVARFILGGNSNGNKTPSVKPNKSSKHVSDKATSYVPLDD